MGTDARKNPHSQESDIVLTPVVFDRLERPLSKDDAVLLPGVAPNLVWKVVDVAPIVDPRAPRNMARISVSTMFHLTAPVHQPIAEILQLRAANAPETLVIVKHPEPWWYRLWNRLVGGW